MIPTHSYQTNTLFSEFNLLHDLRMGKFGRYYLLFETNISIYAYSKNPKDIIVYSCDSSININPKNKKLL